MHCDFGDALLRCLVNRSTSIAVKRNNEMRLMIMGEAGSAAEQMLDHRDFA